MQTLTPRLRGPSGHPRSKHQGFAVPSPALGLEDMGPGLWALTGVRAGSWNHLGGSGETLRRREPQAETWGGGEAAQEREQHRWGQKAGATGS